LARTSTCRDTSAKTETPNEFAPNPGACGWPHGCQHPDAIRRAAYRRAAARRSGGVGSTVSRAQLRRGVPPPSTRSVPLACSGPPMSRGVGATATSDGDLGSTASDNRPMRSVVRTAQATDLLKHRSAHHRCRCARSRVIFAAARTRFLAATRPIRVGTRGPPEARNLGVGPRRAAPSPGSPAAPSAGTSLSPRRDAASAPGRHRPADRGPIRDRMDVDCCRPSRRPAGVCPGLGGAPAISALIPPPRRSRDHPPHWSSCPSPVPG